MFFVYLSTVATELVYFSSLYLPLLQLLPLSPPFQVTLPMFFKNLVLPFILSVALVSTTTVSSHPSHEGLSRQADACICSSDVLTRFL